MHYGLDERAEREAYFKMALDGYMVLTDWQVKADYDAWLFGKWYLRRLVAV
jgi:hypothetical protein